MRVILGSAEAVALADPQAGRVLSRIELPNPSYVVASADRRFAYAVEENPDGPGTVRALRITGDRLLPHGPARLSGGVGPCHLSIHPSGRLLLVANYGDGAAAAMPVAPSGEVEEAACVVQQHGAGPDPERQAGPHAHQAAVDPGGRWALVCDLGADRVAVYRIGEDGRLDLHDETSFKPGTGVRHLAFAPGGRAYAVGELGSTVAACDWDADAGRLDVRETVGTVEEAAEAGPRNYPAAIAVAPDGQRIYVTNRGHDSLTVIDAFSFQVLGVRPCGGRWPRDAALSADGRRLYVANQHSGEVVQFAVNGGLPKPSAAPPIRLPGVSSAVEL